MCGDTLLPLLYHKVRTAPPHRGNWTRGAAFTRTCPGGVVQAELGRIVSEKGISQQLVRIMLGGWPTQACFWLEWGSLRGLSCPRALGFETIPRIRRGSLPDLQLLPSPSVIHERDDTTNLRSRAGTGETQFSALRPAYVVMPEHVHLLVSEPQRGTLAETIKSLKQSVSRRLIGQTEHFWQKRYYDFNIRNHQQFVEKLRYVHRNPVKRGLCAPPEDWPWSSFRHYATGRKGRVEIESEWTARKRERAAGKLCRGNSTSPLKPKEGLSGAPAQRTYSPAHSAGAMGSG